MIEDGKRIELVTDDELSRVRGGFWRSLWNKVKGAARWAKDHIAIGLHSIGIKGKF